MLRFLKLRLVVNGMHIYPLRKNKPVLVTIQAVPSRLVVTNGFHISPAVELRPRQRTGYFNVVCAVDNDLVVGGVIFMLMFFAMGATSGVMILQLFSTLPILYILFQYYIRRHAFIQLQPA